jgi:hypothetical protein
MSLNANRVRILTFLLLVTLSAPAFADYPDHFGRDALWFLAIALLLSTAVATIHRNVAGTLLLLWILPGGTVTIIAFDCVTDERVSWSTKLAAFAYVVSVGVYLSATVWRFRSATVAATAR